MIPRVYKYRRTDGRVDYLCIDEREHDAFFHMYHWRGRRYTAKGNSCGTFKMAVVDFNRIAKEGRIIPVDNKEE